MAWPASVLGIVVEIFVSGGWVDITSYVRRDDGRGVSGNDGTQGTSQRRASPSQVSFQLNNRSGRFSPRNPASPYYGLLTVNTEIRVRVEGFYQFWGEVSSGWPTKWTAGAPATGDAWVPLRAGGRSERINADTTPLPGPLFDLLGFGIDYYWPLTDPSSATSAAPVPSLTGFTDPPRLYPWGLNAPRFAGASGPPASTSVPDFSNRGGLSAALTDGLSGDFYVAVWFKFESGDTTDFGAMSLYQVRLDSNIGNVTGFDVVAYTGISADGINRAGFTCSAYTGYPQGSANRSADMQIDVGGIPCTQDDWHLLRVVYQESGGAVTQALYLDNVLVGSDSGSAAGYTLGALSNITLAANDDSGLFAAPWTANTGIGLSSLAHLVIQTSIIGDIGIYEAGMGFPGETAAARLARVCSANDIGFDLVGTAADTATMTAQKYGGTLASVLEECAKTDGGLLTDAIDMLGLRYVTRVDLYNRVADLALDYTLRAEVMPGLDTDEGASTIENDITATSDVGSSRAQQLTGARNVDEPNDGTGGVGRYPGSLSTSLDTQQQLDDAAAWAVRLATVDVPRFTSVPVSLIALAAAGKTSLWQDAAQVQAGGLITITNTPIWIPDDVAVFAVGRTWRAANYEWDVKFNTVDATAWQHIGGPLEDSTYGRADSEDSYLHAAVTSGATTLLVANTGSEHIPTLWTHADGDYSITIGDEQMTVTAVSTVTPSLIATGTAAYADNASVTPGLPAGATAAGHLMILFAAARTITTVTGVPAGWTQLPGLFDNEIIAAKVHTGSESAPTVTFTGGAAGDTHGAVIASFAGLQARQPVSSLHDEQLIAYSDNTGTSQNIDVLSFKDWRDNIAVMQFGFKQDDWTSVATLSGAAEVYDGSSVLGSDMGLVWDWRAQTTRAAVAAQSFVVTGGLSAVWDSCIMLIDGNIQQLTVTRAAGGTTAAAHAAGAQVRLTNPLILGR